MRKGFCRGDTQSGREVLVGTCFLFALALMGHNNAGASRTVSKILTLAVPQVGVLCLTHVYNRPI